MDMDEENVSDDDYYSLSGDRRKEESDMKVLYQQKLTETGELDRLRILLQNRLIECGWRDEMKAYCKEVLRKEKLENLTVDSLVAKITPKGRELVPDDVKKDLLERITASLKEYD